MSCTYPPVEFLLWEDLEFHLCFLNTLLYPLPALTHKVKQGLLPGCPPTQFGGATNMPQWVPGGTSEALCLQECQGG